MAAAGEMAEEVVVVVVDRILVESRQAAVWSYLRLMPARDRIVDSSGESGEPS